MGRPPTGVGKLIGLRWQPPELDAIDAWRRQQSDLPSRPEAIRRLVSVGLDASTKPARKAPPAPPTQQLASKSPRAIKGRKRTPDALPGG